MKQQPNPLKKNRNGEGDKPVVQSFVPRALHRALVQLQREQNDKSLSVTIAGELLNHGSPRLRQLTREFARTGESPR